MVYFLCAELCYKGFTCSNLFDLHNGSYDCTHYIVTDSDIEMFYRLALNHTTWKW